MKLAPNNQFGGYLFNRNAPKRSLPRNQPRGLPLPSHKALRHFCFVHLASERKNNQEIMSQQLLHFSPTNHGEEDEEEEEEEEAEEQEDRFDFNLLRLGGSSDFTPTKPTSCPTCGGFSTTPNNKRRSPDSTTLPPNLQDQVLPKKPKKLFQEPPSCHGFSTTAQSTTFRCFSDPYDPPMACPDSLCANVCPHSPPESMKTAGLNEIAIPASNGNASLPPRPPRLKRSVSDPTPSSTEIGVDDMPNHETMRKMKDYMKVKMNQCLDEFLPDQQILAEEEEKEAKHNPETITKCDDESVRNVEEAISVERIDDCLNIHFWCPCGQRYQILLHGSSCYYKLM